MFFISISNLKELKSKRKPDGEQEIASILFNIAYAQKLFSVDEQIGKNQFGQIEQG